MVTYKNCDGIVVGNEHNILCVLSIYIYVVNTHIFIYMVYVCDDHHHLDMNISVMNGMDVVYHIVKCALFAHVSLDEDD